MSQKELIQLRGTLRCRLTLFESYLNSLLENKCLNKLQINELTLRLAKVQDLFCQFDEVQSKIESESDEIDKQIKERESTENKYYNIVARAQEVLDSCKLENTQREEASNYSGSHFTSNIKLPPLKLPSFDGNPIKWLEFRDTYVSLIHNNINIDNISKFHYLKSYLEGTASAILKSINVSSENYSIAWSSLCERFDNKRLLINQHLKCLHNIEPLVKESEKGLRNLIDTLAKNLKALSLLGEPTDKWDTLIIYTATAKLDSVTARRWEEFRSDRDSVTLEDFYTFLRNRADVLETLLAGRSNDKQEKRHSLSKTKSFIASSPPQDNTANSQCLACKGDHRLHECARFKSLPINERSLKVQQWKLCSNCLRSGHQAYFCRLGGCRICKRKHNTLLHKQQEQKHNQDTTLHTISNNISNIESVDIPTTKSSSQEQMINNSSVTMSAVSFNQVLLSTALVKVTNNGNNFVLRALLDNGSQSSFISETAKNKIGICNTTKINHFVSGLNNTTLSINEHCNIKIKSLHNSYKLNVKCYVVSNITDKLPNIEVQAKFNIPVGVKMADPFYYKPSEIDLLIGGDVFWELIGPGQFKLGLSQPIIRETQLGWIIAGPIACNNVSQKLYCNFSREIREQLAKFWELEELQNLPSKKILSNEDKYCEELFINTTMRDNDGRFCVQIPLKESPNVLGDSYYNAKKRFLNLEKKMSKNPILKEKYTEFINEYEYLGHLSEIPASYVGCYLPHHAVLREQSETTKLRVVFDASAATSTGKSLNDIQYVGPTIQDDLLSILLRFRQHQYVVTADVEKMYRQILVDPNQRNLQLILWRENEGEVLKTLQLHTVTYGTASAPYLSTRCLLQLAIDCEDKEISEIIKGDFYMDDFLSGSDTHADLSHICDSVTNILKSGCLPLRKYRTNAPNAIKNISLTPNDLEVTTQSTILGLKWQPTSDNLQFSVKFENVPRVTKRTILSNSARIFDPLGLLSAITITPKIILQRLWLTKLDWDDPISIDLEQKWSEFLSNLNFLTMIEIPRCVLAKNRVNIELHSFSDASQNAYAACVYLRSIDNNHNEILTRLLCAKAKVAPLKPTSIPRLELLGALLATRLSVKVLNSLRCKIKSCFHWTDSSVVLGWLGAEPRNLKTYVANRVAEIQDLSPSGIWRHVPGHLNPADLASRGVSPQQLLNASIWWEGPIFLRNENSQWPQMIQPDEELPESKDIIKSNPYNETTLTTTTSLINNNRHYPTHTTKHEFTDTTTTKSEDIYISGTKQTKNSSIVFNLVDWSKYSKLNKVQRVMAYVLRFVNNLRHPTSKKLGNLTLDELELSLHYLTRQAQMESFPEELKLLSNKRNLPLKSSIISLSPFLSKDGLLLVGGRLQQSSVTYTKKHPALLSSNHNFTKLLFHQEHKRLLHCGPQLLLASIRERFWPTKGRILSKNIVNSCKICRILKAKSIEPIMGNLPAPRVIPNLPFQVCGTDFAGPFLITDRKGRGCKITKSYLCLFVCFSTKALHLEVASDLTTDVFILCLRRFISRRGKPFEIYCDNGKNFVGANNEIGNFLKSSCGDITSAATNEGITFKFSPAFSPHFGGIWEAGVKSAKFHLTRILGNTHLTFEELSTLFVQIEAILNSRPLTPLSSDPNDLDPLTPGHFLIGRPLTSLPSPILLNYNPNQLTRYQHIEMMRQQFWTRWSMEYLSELQQRQRWKNNSGVLQEGDLVVIKDPSSPPLRWRMGRVHKLYLGPDGISRVLDVRTSKGIFRHAIRGVCPLPTEPQPCISLDRP